MMFNTTNLDNELQKNLKENENNETTRFAEKSFRIDYFLYIQQIKQLVQLRIDLNNFKYMKIFLVCYLTSQN